jgi:hypothetical protein
MSCKKIVVEVAQQTNGISPVSTTQKACLHVIIKKKVPNLRHLLLHAEWILNALELDKLKLKDVLAPEIRLR